MINQTKSPGAMYGGYTRQGLRGCLQCWGEVPCSFAFLGNFVCFSQKQADARDAMRSHLDVAPLEPRGVAPASARGEGAEVVVVQHLGAGFL